ncbi:MAG: type II toxin-antitoxin system mRNA interferase toxin, RelE/StbE family [bacterium]|nr:type II toxin-antitoxin system mRNA interferase toxin, RelE/StbE family [bacterium]
MEALFERDFVKALKKHASIKKAVERKVLPIIEHPLVFGEPLQGNWRGYYSCPVQRNFIIIYLYCAACRSKQDDLAVQCSDCSERADQTLKFLVLGPHDQAYGL